MTTARYTVTGLTCGYCIAEVMEHLRDLVGVTGVGVDLTEEWAGESEKGTTRVANSPSAARSPHENATREGVR